MDLKEFKRIQEQLVHSGYVCPVWSKLQILALESLDERNLSDTDGRKHRRAVITHSFNCEHPHCKGIAKFGEEVGFDKKTVEKFMSISEPTMREEMEKKLR